MKEKILRWVPAILVMGIIFWFSAQPGDSLPDFGLLDRLVKKMGHVTVYALLAPSYWYGMTLKRERRWLAWLFAILYAVSDEYHQTFTKLRHPSALDVFFFDNVGALLGLWFVTKQMQRNARKSQDEDLR